MAFGSDPDRIRQHGEWARIAIGSGRSREVRAIRYGAEVRNQGLDRDLLRISSEAFWRGAWDVLGSYNEVLLASYN